MENIKILDSKDGKFYATISANNGEVLHTSETLNSKQSVIKNLLAMGKVFFSKGGAIVIWDKTKSARKAYRIEGWGKKKHK